MNFKWDNGMYPSRTPLKTLSEVIGQVSFVFFKLFFDFIYHFFHFLN